MRKPNFTTKNYKLVTNDSSKSLILEGYRLPPPGKRITLHQSNIKVLEAKITHRHKKGDIEFDVIRINHIKSFGEIRLHTNNILYPGNYIVSISYTGELDEEKLKDSISLSQ